jgi:4-hydroxy-4-methyl-2-oxoglutarate aldolase
LDPIDELRELGVSTIYEASGQRGLVDLQLERLLPGSRVAGRARTVRCGQDDNLMVHAAIERIQPGEVVVLCMPEPRPVALVGELLAIQVQARGAAALLIDAAIRDIDELRQLGLPIWYRFVRATGATKLEVGELDATVTVGGARIGPGDVVVLDGDGVVVVPASRLSEVVEASRARAGREAAIRPRLQAGETTYDLHGLRPAVEGD